MTFYRKYRPQTISDLDSLAVQTQVRQMASAGLIPHALLLTGPKGTGKTSTARIIAKLLNCEKLELGTQNLELSKKKTSLTPKSYTLNPNMEPCNQCQSCISITNGNNLDVMEIDAASNRGIDEIRILREGIKLSPVQSRRKIFIIDEVHMLTNEAFNALLKTLEEPPEHAYFILATTEVDKVPDTIRSRSVGIQFSKATAEETIHALKRVAEKEHIQIDDESLQLLAGHADGAFRDAVKILEQITISAQGKAITKSDIENTLGIHASSLDEWLTIIALKNTQALLSFIQTLGSRGINVPGFIKRTIDSLHKEFLARYGVGDSSKLPTLSEQDLIVLMQTLSMALVASKSAAIDILPLELALIEWIGPTKKEGPKVPEDMSKIKKAEEAKGPKSINNVLDWNRVVAAVQVQNHAVAAVLRGCKQLTSSDDEVIIGARYQFHFDKLKDPKMLDVLENVMGELVGKKVKVKVQLEEK